VGRVGHSARTLRPSHPVGLGNLPDPRVWVGRVNPIGLKPDPTVTLALIFIEQDFIYYLVKKLLNIFILFFDYITSWFAIKLDNFIAIEVFRLLEDVFLIEDLYYVDIIILQKHVKRYVFNFCRKEIEDFVIIFVLNNVN